MRLADELAAWAGVVTSIRVELTKVTLGACVLPKVTSVTPLSKPVPVMVTEVPPVSGPLIGATLVTVGGGT